MTIDQISAMSDEEIYAAIAKARGWTQVEHPTTKEKVWVEDKGFYHMQNPLPSYLTSLDACAEFERSLDADQAVQYMKQLNRVHPTACLNALTEGDPDDLWYEAFQLATATARQRCIAFLATVLP